MVTAPASNAADSIPTPPSTLDVIPGGIPAELRAIPQWVGWRWKYVPTQRKPWTKPPVDPRTGRAASVTDPATWGTLQAAVGAMRRHGLPGVGLVLTPELGIIGGDGDGCVEADTGEPDFDARAVLTETATYAERSPSGTGFRFVARGTLPDRIGNGTKKGRYEIYRAGRFLTFTGHRFPFAPAEIEERTVALAALCDRLFPATSNGTHADSASDPDPGSSAGLSDGDILQKALAAKNGQAFAALFFSGDTSAHDGDDSQADAALCCHLAFWTRDPAQIDRLFRRSAMMREKWERTDYRERTIRRALERVTDWYESGPTLTAGGGKFTAGGASTTGAPDPTTTLTAGPLAWPDLPVEALHGLAGDVADTFDHYTEADPAAVLATFLVDFGNAAGRSPHLYAGEGRHGINLFVAIVGATSKARKGESRRPSLRLMTMEDPLWTNDNQTGGIGSGEGIIWAIRDPIMKTEKGELVADDPGVSDKRLLVLEEEFSSLLKVARRDGSIVGEIVRKAWDGATLRNTVKRAPVKATDPHVSIVGHITIEELRRVLDDTDAANGFGNRFLWICARRSKVLPDGGRLPDVEAAALACRVADALRFARATEQMRRSADFAELWRAVYPELSEGGAGLFRAITARSEAQVLRLSLVYALLDGTSTIGADHLTAALAFWRYCEDSARFLFGDRTGDPVADRILDALRHGGEMTDTDISHLFARNLSAGRLSTALTLLLSAGMVEFERVETGGRPARAWRIKGGRAA